MIKNYISYRTQEILNGEAIKGLVLPEGAESKLYSSLNCFFSATTAIILGQNGRTSLSNKRDLYFEPINKSYAYNKEENYIEKWDKLFAQTKGKACFYIVSESQELGQWQGFEALCAIHENLAIRWISLSKFTKIIRKFVEKTKSPVLQVSDEELFFACLEKKSTRV